jgi:hypothetical protein
MMDAMFGRAVLDCDGLGVLTATLMTTAAPLVRRLRRSPSHELPQRSRDDIIHEFAGTYLTANLPAVLRARVFAFSRGPKVDRRPAKGRQCPLRATFTQIVLSHDGSCWHEAGQEFERPGTVKNPGAEDDERKGQKNWANSVDTLCYGGMGAEKPSGKAPDDC